MVVDIIPMTWKMMMTILMPKPKVLKLVMRQTEIVMCKGQLPQWAAGVRQWLYRRATSLLYPPNPA